MIHLSEIETADLGIFKLPSVTRRVPHVGQVGTIICSSLLITDESLIIAPMYIKERFCVSLCKTFPVYIGKVCVHPCKTSPVYYSRKGFCVPLRKQKFRLSHTCTCIIYTSS